ncbi:MAG: hypothetical protein RR767_12685 [Acinetobacter sp.]
MNTKINFIRVMFATISLSLSTSILAVPLKILEFKKGELTQAEQKQLCQQVKDLCVQSVQLRSLKTADQNLWILSSRNDIAQFKSSSKGFKLVREWSVVTAEREDVSHKQYVFPKLFPLTQKRYAIAIIDQFSEMYSGGGAGIERASFYELKDAGLMKQFIKNYPFSLNRMIRACFSEQDYESSKGNCHDEDALSLDIRPMKPMLWQFRYGYNLSVSPASDSEEKSYKRSKILNVDLNHVPPQPSIPAEWNYLGM